MLTDTKLRSLKARESVYRIADAGGLCIEVRPTGAKLWRYRYRYTHKARMLSLGEYPAVSLLEARRKRDEARAVLAGGIDPTLNAKAKRLAVAERAALDRPVAIGSGLWWIGARRFDEEYRRWGEQAANCEYDCE